MFTERTLTNQQTNKELSRAPLLLDGTENGKNFELSGNWKDVFSHPEGSRQVFAHLLYQEGPCLLCDKDPCSRVNQLWSSRKE